MNVGKGDIELNIKEILDIVFSYRHVVYLLENNHKKELSENHPQGGSFTLQSKAVVENKLRVAPLAPKGENHLKVSKL